MEEPKADRSWVVGVDGSPNSLAALRWALINGAGRADRIVAVAAWQHTQGDPDPPTPVVERTMQHRLELQELLVAVGADERAVAVSRFGSPVDALLEVSRSGDLIVVGSRERGRVRRTLAGSVSHECAVRARVPVVVVPPTLRPFSPIERIVVGFDGSANARQALAWTLDFSGPDAEVVVVVATGSRRSGRAFQRGTGTVTPDFEALVGEISGEAGPAGRVRLAVEATEPIAALATHSRTASLLVLGARGKGAVAAALLGSVSSRYVSKPPCPLALVPALLQPSGRHTRGDDQIL